jgi:putative ABC transport system permease protein
MKAKPPAWIEKLLGRFLTPRLLEAMLGDLEEKFLRRISNHEPPWKARLLYAVEATGFLRMARSQNKANHFDMFKNNLKLAVRNFTKQRTTSLINIFCLTAAIACSIPVYLFVYSELNSEYFHKKGSTIFLVESQISKDGNLRTLGKSPVALGPAMIQELPLVTQAVRVDRTIGVINLGDDKRFNQWVHYVDPDFMEMFTFPLKAGNPDALHHPNTIILSDFAA